MMYRNVLIFLMGAVCMIGVSGQFVPVQEDYSCKQSSDQVIKRVSNALLKLDCDKNFGVVQPTEQGIALNPANEVIASGWHPTTNNALLVINEPWFFTLSEHEQEFLCMWHGMRLQKGLQSPWFWYVVIGFILLSIFFIVSINYILKKMGVISQKWLRLVVAFCVVFLLNTMVLNHVQQSLLNRLNLMHNTTSLLAAARQVTDISAPRKAMEHVYATIQQSSHQEYWKPYYPEFRQYISELQKFEKQQS